MSGRPHIIILYQYNSLAISPPCYIDIIDIMIYRGSTNFESRKAPLQSMHTKRNGAAVPQSSIISYEK